jgi:hypothetical protein
MRLDIPWLLAHLLRTLHRIILAEVLSLSILPGEQIKETAAVIYILKITVKNGL